MKSTLITLALAVVAARIYAAPVSAPDRTLLILKGVPANGLVIARTSMTAPKGSNLSAQLPDGSHTTVQYVADGGDPTHGTLVARLPHGGDYQLHLSYTPGGGEPSASKYVYGGTSNSVRFGAGKTGGLPSSFTFTKSSRVFDEFSWNDRLHDPKLGGYLLRFDPAAQCQQVSDGPVCTVVRYSAYYCKQDGTRPQSNPRAQYDWFVFKNTPLIYVQARITQDTPFSWSELHFLEMNFAGQDFTHYAGGSPAKQGALSSAKATTRFENWGALVNGQDVFAMFGAPVLLYDGHAEYGTYLHSTWRPWSDTQTDLSTWLWVGGSADPAADIQQAAAQNASKTTAISTTPALHQRIGDSVAAATRKRGHARSMSLWLAGFAKTAEAGGNLQASANALDGRLPKGCSLHTSGSLGLGLCEDRGGVAVNSLFDLRLGQELLTTAQPPLFSIGLRRVSDKRGVTVTADTGWRSTRVTDRSGVVEVKWIAPADKLVDGLNVTARAVPDSGRSAWKWSLQVHPPRGWSVIKTLFPQVAVAQPCQGATVLYPAGPGVLYRTLWQQETTQKSLYPNGWCSMQFMAVCAGTSDRSGLYVGWHDPYGGSKDIAMSSDAATHSVRLWAELPAPNMTLPDNDFTMCGDAVWQVLRGDWYDAAQIYRTWVKREAKWWPALSAEGRTDTPLWMRELCGWALTGGAPSECVQQVKQMQATLGVPIGFHWYNWHGNPFDNDYPHYFPTKPGVDQGVKELQASNVYVMPYINGRLWDTRDRGAEDFEFSSVALPAATKQEDGKPYVESYGSKEADGSDVRLAVMCPTTELWQRTVRDTVLRIMNEVGTKAVYIDQIGAASPVLCMDPSHGHPLGGGHWWTQQGYWPLLTKLRAQMPKDHMITTECNGEPYARWIDGYLTWHWQSDGMVPAFPAIYGGAVQMFSRSYAATGATRDDALCMKMGQQLVFGEQIGWLGPEIAQEKVAGGYLKQTVLLRHQLRRYFYAGEMARPLKLIGKMPTVRADWQWGGEDWVTTDAVLTGAWRLPRERKLTLLFANVSDKPVSLTVNFNASAYGIGGQRLKAVLVTAQDRKDMGVIPSTYKREVTFAPRSAMAWEVSW